METFEMVLQIIGEVAALISTGVGLAFGIVSFVKLMQSKTEQGRINFILEIAEAGIVEAEKTGKSGAEKKQIVIDAVTAACNKAGFDIAPFITQLSAFIDKWVANANAFQGK